MLQFWKKSDRKQKGKQNYVNGSTKTSLRVPNNSTKVHEEIVQLNVQNGPYVPRSRLSKTLSEVLADKDALGYFIQFMDSKSALALIKFWLDIESFRSATGLTDENDEILLSPEENSVISNISVDLNDEVFDTKSLHSHTQNNLNSETILENGISKQNGDNNIPKRRIDSCQSDFSNSISTDCDSLYLTPDYENENETKTNGPEIFEKCHRKLGSVHSLQTESKNHIEKSYGNNGVLGNYKIKRTYSVPQDFEETNMKRTISMTSLRKRKDLYSSIFQDAVRISKKYICDNAPNFVKLPDGLKLDILNRIRGNIINQDLFAHAQDYVFTQIKKDYFNQFLRSDFNTKYQIDILTSGNVILEDILFNEMALFHFMEFVEQENCINRDFVEFWLSAVNFRQNCNDITIDQMESDAMTLYDKYFSLQAMNPLHLGDEIRFHVEQNICREQGPALTSFDLPLQIIQTYLEKNYLKSFLMSQVFFKYLNELINSIHTNTFNKHRKTDSNASSEFSMNFQRKTSKKEKCKDKFDMSIETSSMIDPDTLWRRKKIGLKFGFVNELGRFQSDLEKEPEDGRSNWRFSKAMRRLVVGKKDITKEEIAWQVAEMIVKDITSLTMKEYKDDNS